MLQDKVIWRIAFEKSLQYLLCLLAAVNPYASRKIKINP